MMPLLQKLKKVNGRGQYKESEEKLATIPVSDLGKPHYSIVKETVEKLNNQNNEGLKKDKKKSRLKSKRSRVQHQRNHLNQFQMNLLNGQPRIFLLSTRRSKSKRV